MNDQPAESLRGHQAPPASNKKGILFGEFEWSLQDIGLYFRKWSALFIFCMLAGSILGFIYGDKRTFYRSDVVLQMDREFPFVMKNQGMINLGLNQGLNDGALALLYGKRVITLADSFAHEKGERGASTQVLLLDFLKSRGSEQKPEFVFSDYLTSDFQSHLQKMMLPNTTPFGFLIQSAPSGLAYNLSLILSHGSLSKEMIEILATAFNDFVSSYNEDEYKRRQRFMETKKDQIKTMLDQFSRDFSAEVVGEHEKSKLETSMSFFGLEKKVSSIERRLNIRPDLNLHEFGQLNIGGNQADGIDDENSLESMKTFSFLRRLSAINGTSSKTEFEDLHKAYSDLEVSRRNNQIRYAAQRKVYVAIFEELQKFARETSSPIDRSVFALPPIDLRVFKASGDYPPKSSSFVERKISFHVLGTFGGIAAGLLLAVFLTLLTRIFSLRDLPRSEEKRTEKVTTS